MIGQIFSGILLTGLLVFVTLMFIEIHREFHEEYADERRYIKNTLKKWYRGTRLFMWNNNRKNGVKILSEREYNRMLTEGKIKYVVIEEEG